MKDIADLMGRVFLSFIFLYQAYDAIIFSKTTKLQMAEYGITSNQNFLLLSGIGLLVLGGILILIGYRAQFGAFLLLLFWIPVTFVVYSFWNDPEPEHRENAIQFMKNIAITGGLLMVFVNGAGKYSIKRLFATFKVPGTGRR